MFSVQVDDSSIFFMLGGRRLGKKNYGSPKVVRSISVKDVIAVVEKEPQVSRSTLLYRLYNRICSDVPTQDMT